VNDRLEISVPVGPLKVQVRFESFVRESKYARVCDATVNV